MARNRDEYRRQSVERSNALEDAWFASSDAGEMLRTRPVASERQLRLFACACCHRVSHGFIYGWESRALTRAEKMADGGQREPWFDEIEETFGPGLEPAPSAVACVAVWWEPFDAAERTVENAARAMITSPMTGEAEETRERTVQANLLRDIFGNPFRPIVFDPGWRSEAAVALARAAYEARNFTLLPILADALEEAGCDRPDVLSHCRGPGPHARGCWVVDLVLNKS